MSRRPRVSSRLSVRRAILLALVAMIALPSGVLGYQGQNVTNVTVTGPTGQVQCGVPVQVTARLIDNQGRPATEHTVDWTVVPANGGTFAQAQTVTDANGNSTNTFTPSCDAGGSVTIRASADGAFGQLVLNLTDTTPPISPIPAMCGTALGLASSGFDRATEVQRRGRYVTWRFSFGPEYANRLVVIATALRFPIPFLGRVVWTPFVPLTIRRADANGDVTYWLRSRTALWISVRAIYLGSADLAAKYSFACQARWI